MKQETRDRKMKVIMLDGKKMTTPDAAHAHIAEMAGFPAYYGKNLDALADCLGELRPGTYVILMNDADMRRSLGSYADRLIDVFESAAAEPHSFDFTICTEQA